LRGKSIIFGINDIAERWIAKFDQASGGR